MRNLITILFFLFFTLGYSQRPIHTVYFSIRDATTNVVLEGVEIKIYELTLSNFTNKEGSAELKLEEDIYQMIIFKEGYRMIKEELIVKGDLVLKFRLDKLENNLKPIEIIALADHSFSNDRLNNVEGTSIYAGKKNDVILMDKINANLATNNPRQIFAKVAGLNIWESDAAGLQMGIGGRGLSPNRTSNFNTRQNGYDMAADALGYPESYYTPPSESIDRIEVIRGASSLQYGSQFGGVVNFVSKKGTKEKPFEFLSRQTLGSFGLYNTFNSVGGTIKNRLNYYTFYQYKKGNGWRENSDFNQQTAYAALRYSINENVEISGDYTRMTYLAHQPGGLSDQMFLQNPQQSIRDRNWFKVNWNLFSLSLNYKISSKSELNIRNYGLVASRLALGFLGSINRADPLQERELISGFFKNFGNETRFLTRYKLKKSMGVFLVGTRYYQGKTATQQGLASNGFDADFRYLNPTNLENSDYTFPSKNWAAFVENIFYINEKWSVTPGFRFENIQTASGGYYKIRNTDLAGNVIYEETIETTSQYKRNVPLAGIGFSYKKSIVFESYANISQNYRAINFSDVQIVNPNSRVDPNIQDEYGFNADIGWRGKLKNIFTYDISLFMLKYDNRIGEILQTDESNFTVYRFRTNIADSRNLGVEFFAEIDALKIFNDSTEHSLKLFVNTSFIDARYLYSEQSAVSNNKVELVPSINLKTGLGYSYQDFSVQTQFSYISEQFSDATNSEFTSNAIYGLIPSYFVLDFSASYSYKRWKLESGINNFTNENYFTRRAVSYPGPGIIPSEVRNFYCTLQFKF
jgi:Fe(3+) dicitrate transport protein